MKIHQEKGKQIIKSTEEVLKKTLKKHELRIRIRYITTVLQQKANKNTSLIINTYCSNLNI